MIHAKPEIISPDDYTAGAAMIGKRPLVKTVTVKHERRKRLIFALYVLAVILVSLAPGDLIPSSELSWAHMDKVGHFLAYIGLGSLIGLTFPTRNGRILAALCTIMLGFLLEWGQSFVPGREMSLADGLVNTGGVLLGLVLFRLWSRFVAERLDIL